ncbi:MAG: iron-containing alcohol dehydrogenase [Kouleothrix sp.]|nr:iron-containing alcohol dehydrogenase [Kouleothrix sp.]
MVDFFEFQLRTRVLYKPGLVREMSNEVEAMGARRAFIVTDKGVEQAGLLDRVRDSLQSPIEVVGTFTDVPADSEVTTVEQAAAQAREAQADLIIGVGGGSPIDTAKAVRILLSEGGNLHDYEGANLLTRPLLPMIAIPTTAGTGSEVTWASVIRDEAAGVKLLFVSPVLAPDLAVLDPEMTRTLPPHLTAATGIDALSHAIEALVGTGNNPITDSLALQAIDMISNHLRDATFTGDDMEARGQMMVASCIAGVAFSSGFQGGNVGIVHAAAHSIGAAFHVHHGSLIAILLPHGMRFNSVVVPNRYSRIARAMGVNAGGRPEDDVIEDGVAAVSALAAECGLPIRLRDVGVPEDALPAMAEATIVEGSMFTNPRLASYEEALDMLRAAW